MTPDQQEKVERVITVWPCEHGATLIERHRIRKNYTCATCGAKPEFFVPEAELTGAIEERDEWHRRWKEWAERGNRYREALEKIAHLGDPYIASYPFAANAIHIANAALAPGDGES